MSDTYDVVAELRFLRSDEGGLEHPTPNTFLACSMLVQNQCYDCRVLLHSIGSVEPGSTIVAPMKFLDWENVGKWVRRGDRFSLWAGKVIAAGTVLEIEGQSHG
jgi:hypothetical protein